MTTRPYIPCFKSSRGLAATSLLASALFAVSWTLLAPISTASAGEWVQRSCSFGSTEYIVPGGWEGEENYGYDQMPFNNCERYYNGGGLVVSAAGGGRHQPALSPNVAIQGAALCRDRGRCAGTRDERPRRWCAGSSQDQRTA